MQAYILPGNRVDGIWIAGIEDTGQKSVEKPLKHKAVKASVL